MTIKTIKRKLEDARAKYAELKIITDGIHPRFKNKKADAENAAKEAKKHGFSNLWYWADSAMQRNLITDEQRLKCHTYKLVRDNDSHGGAGDFSPSERVIENLEKLLEILQNDDFQRKHHYPYHKMIYPPVKIEP